MQKIGFLPEHLIDQIKAGEVIERPSNLLKELLENSMDANSSEISVHIKESGVSLVHLEDNGEGIAFEELPMAFTRHATSKIKDYEDLYHLHTFGFRGEALASIASISRLTCYSKTEDGKGGKIVIHGGHHLEHSEHPLQKRGTSFFIKDLFYNTPARLKFVKSRSAEKRQIQKILHSFLLCHPQVDFNLKWDDQGAKTYKEKDLFKRIEKLWGMEKKDDSKIYHFSQEFEGHTLEGYYGPSVGKSNNNKLQYLFANKRMIEDKRLHSQILKALEPYWGDGNYGHYLFFLSVPEDQLDVNVHPQKTFVKFLKDSVVYSLIVNGIKSSFHKNEVPLRAKEQHKKEESVFGNKGLLRLNSKFWLTQKEGQNYLIKSSKIIPNILSQFWSKNFPVEDENCLPLLIGEPIKNENISNEEILMLKDYGFHFKRINSEKLILNAIPDLKVSLNYNKLGQWVLKHRNELIQIQDKEFFLDEGIDLETLSRLITEPHRWIKNVDELDLERLFK